MVETSNPTSSSKSPVPTPTQVWSRYNHIQEMTMKPFPAIINLVGAKSTTHDELTKIIKSGLEQHIWKNVKNDTNYARPIYRILSNDLPCACPRPVKRRGASSSEIGYLKGNFFKSFSENKPAVTVFIYDWRNWSKIHPADEQFDWKSHENLVLD